MNNKELIAALEAKLAVAREALEGIADLCNDEIEARFVKPHSDGAGRRAMQKSRIYPLLQMPRDLARQALEELDND